MKKILFIIAVILLLSCESEEMSCYTCTTYINTEEISNITVCKMTGDEIIVFQSGLQVQATAIIGIPCKTECLIK
jgi:hypothetical protein